MVSKGRINSSFKLAMANLNLSNFMLWLKPPQAFNQTRLYYSKPFQFHYPIDPFTNLEPHNPSIDISELRIIG